MRLPAVLAAAVLLAGCAGGTQAGGAAPSGPGATGAPAPAAALVGCPEQTADPAAGGEALPDLVFDCPAGGSLDLTRAPGVPTVVNLWGSWCAPCREELPLFEELATGAGDRVRVVGLISKDGLPQAGSFAADAGITFPSAFDGEGQLMAEFGLNALPFTMFLAADGTLVHTRLGPVASVEELRGLVADHLGVQL